MTCMAVWSRVFINFDTVWSRASIILTHKKINPVGSKNFKPMGTGIVT
jgi:hypothetical protein